jgi:hypothetical protein
LNFQIIKNMKNNILILLLVFTFCSCNSEDVGKGKWNKKALMDSWAWKIFVFTDLGETLPNANAKNNFGNSTKVNAIFVDDFDITEAFLTEQKVTLSDPIKEEKRILFKRKK